MVHRNAFLALMLAIIVVSAGVVTYAVVANNDTIGVDTPKTIDDLAVGDYITTDVSATYNTDESYEGADSGEFLSQLYVKIGTKVDTTTFTYKGQEILCDVYKFDGGDGEINMTYNDPVSGVAYYHYRSWDYMESIDLERTLKDTNLDLTKIKDEQIVSADSFILFDYKSEIMTDMLFEGTHSLSWDSYDAAGDSGTLIENYAMGCARENLKSSIISITGGGLVLTDSDPDPMTRNAFLSEISYDAFIASAEEGEYEVAHGEKTSKTIDTAFGKRNVTVEKLTLSDNSSSQEVVLTYGEKGFIYQTEVTISEIEPDQENVMITISTVVDTNLRA